MTHLVLQPGQASDPEDLTALAGIIRHHVLLRLLLELLDLLRRHGAHHHVLGQSVRRDARDQLNRQTGRRA